MLFRRPRIRCPADTLAFTGRAEQVAEISSAAAAMAQAGW